MRVFLYATVAIFAALPPAFAWQTVPGPICTMAHEEAGGGVVVTYHPATGTYAIELTQFGATWPEGDVFAIRFDPYGPVIATDRHQIMASGATIRVADTGFGNVLNGLERNHSFVAVIGDTELRYGLDGAAPVVRAFRACTDGLLS